MHSGLADSILWFSIHNFGKNSLKTIRDDNLNSAVMSPRVTEVFNPTVGDLNAPLMKFNNRDSTLSRPSQFDQSGNDGADESGTFDNRAISVEEDFGIDIDLSPQLNLALRHEVLLYNICLFYKDYDS